MKPLSASEAHDLARVVSHAEFCELRHSHGWIIGFRRHPAAIWKRTLRAALRAAVRWIEEQEAHHG